MKRLKQKNHKRDSTKNIEKATKHEEVDPKTKALIKFDKFVPSSMKSLAVKKYEDVKPTICFISGKMLMPAKFSPISPICDLIETFIFLNKKIKEIYEKYMIDYIFSYHVLTDTDSTCTFFIFVCKSQSEVMVEKYRECLCEVIVANEILNRFDTLNKFLEQFEARNPK